MCVYSVLPLRRRKRKRIKGGGGGGGGEEAAVIRRKVNLFKDRLSLPQYLVNFKIQNKLSILNRTSSHSVNKKALNKSMILLS